MEKQKLLNITINEIWVKIKNLYFLTWQINLSVTLQGLKLIQKAKKNKLEIVSRNRLNSRPMKMFQNSSDGEEDEDSDEMEDLHHRIK